MLLCEWRNAGSRFHGSTVVRVAAPAPHVERSLYGVSASVSQPLRGLSECVAAFRRPQQVWREARGEHQYVLQDSCSTHSGNPLTPRQGETCLAILQGESQPIRGTPRRAPICKRKSWLPKKSLAGGMSPPAAKAKVWTPPSQLDAFCPRRGWLDPAPPHSQVGDPLSPCCVLLCCCVVVLL